MLVSHVTKYIVCHQVYEDVLEELDIDDFCHASIHVVQHASMSHFACWFLMSQSTLSVTKFMKTFSRSWTLMISVMHRSMLFNMQACPILHVGFSCHKVHCLSPSL